MPESRGIPRGEQPAESKAEKREAKKFRVGFDVASVASLNHVKYNEDTVLGDNRRLMAEAAKMPVLEIGRHFDYAALLDKAAKMEAEYAPKLREKNVFGILDGMGGAGEGRGLIASRIAAAEISHVMADLPDDADGATSVAHMRTALESAHRTLTFVGKRSMQLSRMGTTAAIGRVIENDDGTRDLAFANVSARVYVFDPVDQKLRQYSKDQSHLEKMVEQGKLTQEEFNQVDQTMDPTKLPDKLHDLYMDRNIVDQGLSPGNKFAINTGIVERLRPGSKVLMLTDGMYDNLTREHLERLLQNRRDLGQIAAAAQDTARKRKGRYSVDDISGVMIEIPPRRRIDRLEREPASEPEATSTETRRRDETADIERVRRQVREIAPEVIDRAPPPVPEKQKSKLRKWLGL